VSFSLEVVLPWPGVELSPNGRKHWSAKARATKAYRDTAYVLGRQAMGHRGAAPEGDYRVALRFRPPNIRNRDQDNMVASMKSGLDGLAQAMGLNDHKFRLDEPELAEVHEGGAVLVRIYQNAATEARKS
jgi:crossover junction endodeoxyribonuclease RusA